MSSGGIIILIFFIIGIVKNVHPAAKSDELQEKRKGQNLNSKLCPFFAPEAGLEPATLWLTVRCSNQLSYSGIYVSRTSFRFGTANVLQKFLCANFLRYFYENFASFSVLTCHFIVAATEIGIGSVLSLLLSYSIPAVIPNFTPWNQESLQPRGCFLGKACSDS